MKKINDCKECFKDVFMNCLEEDAVEKSIFESTEKAQIEMLCETLKFVYGEKFENVRLVWTQEALNEFYSHKTV